MKFEITVILFNKTTYCVALRVNSTDFVTFIRRMQLDTSQYWAKFPEQSHNLRSLLITQVHLFLYCWIHLYAIFYCLLKCVS